MSRIPRISVVVPAYNPGHYLEGAVYSVIAQTFSDWELVVVDDGSSEPLAVVDHPAVKFIRQENQGASVARNTGILATTGEMIAFLDADDLWQPQKLEHQIQVMDGNPEVGLCHTSFEVINASGEVTGPGFQGYDKDYQELLTGCGICASTVMIRRGCLADTGLFDPLCPPAEDYDLWLKLSRRYALARVESIEAFYRVHGGNISGNYARMYRMQTSILSRHLLLAESRNDFAAMSHIQQGIKRAKLLYGNQAYENARRSLRQRAIKPFASHLLFAAMHAPKYVAASLLSCKGRK